MARKLVVEIIGDASSLEKSFRRAGNETETFGQKFAKVGKVAAVAGAAIGVAAFEVGKKFAEAAIKAQEETGKLNQAFENAGVSAEKMGKFVSKTEASQRKLGFTNSDTRDALAKFVTAGDNTTAALKDLGLASDYARFKGIGLADASLVLVRAHAGNLRALKSLGLSMKPVTIAMDKLKEAHKKSKKPIEDWEKAIARNADASATYEVVAKKLQERIGGQAKEFSKSAAGGMAQFHAQLGNIEETLGAKLLPAIAKVIKVLNDLLQIVTGNGSAGEKFRAVLERMGVSAETSRRILADLKTTFNDLKAVVVSAFNIIRPVLEAFLTQIQGIVQLVSDLIHGRWGKIWGDAVTIVRNTVKLWISILRTGITLLGGIALKIGSALATGILNGLKGLAGKIIALIVAPINAIIRAINLLPFVHINEIGAGGSKSGKTPPAATLPGGSKTGTAGPQGPQTMSSVHGGRGSFRVGGVAINGPVTVVANNPNELIAGLQRAARRQTGSRSGPYAGHTLGLT